MELLLFVDYDNLPRSAQQGALSSVVSSIVGALDADWIVGYRRIRIRLYGGWYKGKEVSRKSQDLLTEIGDFPRMVGLRRGKSSVIVNVEIAFSSLVAPTKHFYYTYRERGAGFSLVVAPPTSHNCQNTNCPVTIVKNVLSSGRCTDCGLPQSKFLFRPEQKLIDTMMSTDMIFVANSGAKKIAFLSNDDDFYPPLVLILHWEVSVLHFRPSTSASSGSGLYESAGNGYKLISLSFN
ncbi:MAG: hypothetical protein U0176_08500 [Bacteroidia bacterium]